LSENNFEIFALIIQNFSKAIMWMIANSKKSKDYQNVISLEENGLLS